MCLAILLTLILISCASTTPTEDLARHYAPVIRQGVVSDQDYITAVDFDGDWIGNNNWENQPTGDLSAYVYYSVIESKRHWFIFYSLFHPRDYTYEDCATSGGVTRTIWSQFN